MTVAAMIASFMLGGVQAKPEPYTISLPQSVAKIAMVPIPAGEILGVKLKPYFIATTETTWEAFDAFLASGAPGKPYDQTEYTPDAIARPSKSYILPDLGWGHRGFPAMNLSDTNVMMFCRWLSQVTGKKYRVPTEAEWEWAARAGQKSWTFDKKALDEQAWHIDNAEETTHPVAKLKPNAWGLYDMLGNVGEWATDLKGKPVLCGPRFVDTLDAKFSPSARNYWQPAWQERDPQMPKSRWWLSDGPFCGFRVVCEG